MNSGYFPTTAWSVVRAAQGDDDEKRLEAMNRCMATYWRPVFYFIRARGYSTDRAEDLTQEFFLRFFAKDWIRRADQKKGRFRNFLLKILTRFLADQSEYRARKQKTFENRCVAISALMQDSDRNYEPPTDQTPEQIFMQQWAQAVLSIVRMSVAAWCNERGRPDQYQMFRAVHFPEAGAPKVTQESLAAELGVTRDKVRSGLRIVNEQFIAFLREELSDQIGPDDSLEDEIRELERLL